MFKNQKIILAIYILLMFLMLCSCDFDESKNNFYGGELLDDEKISILKDELNTEDNENGEAENKPNENGIQDENQIVYWTDSGKVWHASIICHHVKNSANVVSGTQREAEEAGKKYACSNCCK